METLENVVTSIREFVWEAGIPVGDSTIPVVVIALIGAGTFLTLRLGFIQLGPHPSCSETHRRPDRRPTVPGPAADRNPRPVSAP